MSDSCDGQKEAAFVSSLPDFAQIFLFLQKFGSLLMFPPVFLSDLENFFLSGEFSKCGLVTNMYYTRM